MDAKNGVLLDASILNDVKNRFHYVDHGPTGIRRLYFDNAGGSLRLKTAVEQLALIDSIPDCAERLHRDALFLQDIQNKGISDIRTIFNAQDGSIYVSLTASGAMFDLVRAIAESIPGSNMVTSVLEHPSSFDAMTYYARLRNKELRVAKSNPVTGGVDVEDIVALVDKNTVVLSVMYASNISGAKIDIESIVSKARAIKPDLYIVIDAVQHAPHGLIDLKNLDIDAINIAPYKFFGCRGMGISWLSTRAANLPHHKLNGKPEDFWNLGSAAPGQYAMVSAVVDYVCWLGGRFINETDRRALFATGMRKIERHERALLSLLLDGSHGHDGLRNIPGVTVHLDNPDLEKRDLIIAMSFNGLAPAEAVREYERYGVIVYERVLSSIYSSRMLESFSMSGAVRVSPMHCHSPSDICEFLQITKKISSGCRQ